MAEDQNNPKPGEDEEEKGPEAESNEQTTEQAGPADETPEAETSAETPVVEEPVAEETAPEQAEADAPVMEEEAPAEPVAEDDTPEIVGEQPEIAPEQLAPETAETDTPVVEEEAPAEPVAEDAAPEVLGEQPDVLPEALAPETAEADTPSVDEEEPAEPEALSTDPLMENEEAAPVDEELLADAAPQGVQPNVFDIDADEERPEGLEMIGVTPGDLPLGQESATDGPNTPVTEEEEPASPDGVSDHDVNAGQDQPAADDVDGDPHLVDQVANQQDVDDEWRELNAREHLQDILKKREGRTELEEEYLNEVKGLKYYTDNDSMKINIGWGKSVIDSPQGVAMGSGFFTQEAAEMMIAITRTHDWAHDRPIKLHGSQKNKNKLWLAAMRQGVQVDPSFNPDQKYIDKWNDDPKNPKNQPQEDQNMDDLYPAVTPGEGAAQEAPAGGEGGPEQQVPEQVAEELAGEELGGETPPAQEVADLVGQEAQDVNPVSQDTSAPVLDEETANASPEELEEYKAEIDGRISAAIDELSAREDQGENVQKLRETQEALQGGQFDVASLQRVDSALLHQKFDVALNAVKPADMGAPVQSADLADNTPAAPRNDTAGKMKM